MFKFLLTVILGLSPILSLAQSSAPPGINASRYVYCLNEGLGKGRSYTTPQVYCQQWAGPSAAVARIQSDDGKEVPCGMTWSGNPIYMIPSRCEAYLNASRAEELAQHKAWLAQQVANAKAAAATSAAAAKNDGGAIFNCSFKETCTPANGCSEYPPYTTSAPSLAQQIIADSLDQANAKAAVIARAATNRYWVATGSCSLLALIKNI